VRGPIRSFLGVALSIGNFLKTIGVRSPVVQSPPDRRRGQRRLLGIENGLGVTDACRASIAPSPGRSFNRAEIR